MDKPALYNITANEPMCIVKDFRTFTTFLHEHLVELTKGKEQIGRKYLYRINELMTEPQAGVTERSEQLMYPLLHMFFHLVLAGKLFQKVPVERNKITLRPTERYPQFLELTPTEQYMFLLETFWVDLDWNELAERGSNWKQGVIDKLLGMVKDAQDGQVISANNVEQPLLSNISFSFPSDYPLYLSYFGFWQFIRDELSITYSKREFRAKAIVLNRFGIAMAKLLSEYRPLDLWNIPGRLDLGEYQVAPGAPLPEKWGSNQGRIKKGKKGKWKAEPFHSLFIGLFPEGELQRTLPRKLPEFTEGNYRFKVSLSKKVWRSVELSAHHDLANLHAIIQEAFKFNDDHLYCFFIDGKLWSRRRFASPLDDEGPYVTGVRVGDLGLEKSQKFLYLFDYGASWLFQVELEEISRKGPGLVEPQVVAAHGESPEQYPFY